MWMSPADIDTRPQEPAFPRVSLLFQLYSLAVTFIRQPIDQSMTLCIHVPAMGPSAVRTMLAGGYAAFFFFSVFSAIFPGNLLFVSAAVRQAPSSVPSYPIGPRIGPSPIRV